MTLRCWKRTIYQDECLLIIFNVQGCQEDVLKNWVEKSKTLTKNPKYVTEGHSRKGVSLFWTS